MATAVGLDASPLNVLRSMRGEIVDARIAYPEVLHIEVKDSAGEPWKLATQDAEWSPSDPAELVGRSVDDADIDGETGELRCKLSDGSLLDVKPAAREAEDDPPNWELLRRAGSFWSSGRVSAGRSVARTAVLPRVPEPNMNRSRRRFATLPRLQAGYIVAR
jgi:hypothetical protein